jgi:hypothetical protein
VSYRTSPTVISLTLASRALRSLQSPESMPRKSSIGRRNDNARLLAGVCTLDTNAMSCAFMCVCKVITAEIQFAHDQIAFSISSSDTSVSYVPLRMKRHIVTKRQSAAVGSANATL